MSEADTEFRNLMVETLKQDGTLAKIRVVILYSILISIHCH